MDRLLKMIFQNLDERIDECNKERTQDGLPPLSTCKIVIMGQVSLFLDVRARDSLELNVTRDVDAVLEGDWFVRNEFKKLLKEHQLIYDELSDQIWLPEEFETEFFFKGTSVHCERVLPLYVITSKAVRALEKNRSLVIDSISEYGSELIVLLEKYGVDVERLLKR